MRSARLSQIPHPESAESFICDWVVSSLLLSLEYDCDGDAQNICATGQGTRQETRGCSKATVIQTLITFLLSGS